MTPRYDDLRRPPLSQQDLARDLTRDRSRWREIEVVDEVASTSSVLAERARAGAPDGIVLLAEHQTAGRGRLQRTWTSPPRAGITMSVLLRPVDVPVSWWPWIPLVTGLAVAAAVNGVARVPAVLKWPNDVLVGGLKLAGVLVERVEEAPGGAAERGAGAAAVVGIGVNVTTTADELPLPQATSLLLEDAETTDRGTLVKAILRRLEGLLAEWEQGGGRPSPQLRAAYESACATLGQPIVARPPGAEPVEGEAVGIDDSGRLLVRTESGQLALGAGDVLHREALT